MTVQCILPAELVSKILYHTDPRDIIRWRTVSKWFHIITCDTALWKHLYKNASFPRPPGLLPTHSTPSLERALVKSARLAQSWTTQTMRDTSSVRVQLDDKSGLLPKLIYGRWLLICESGAKLILLDVDAMHDKRADPRRVLWEQEDMVVTSWHVSPIAPVDGQCVVYVLFDISLKWMLVELRLDYESGKLLDSVAINPTDYSRLQFLSEFCTSGSSSRTSPFIFIPTLFGSTVFDTRTRAFYKVPEFHFALDSTPRQRINHDQDPLDRNMLFTDSHAIAFTFFQGFSFTTTVVQVFTLPPDGPLVDKDKQFLCMTHECVIDACIMAPAFLRSTVDPATGTTNVTLMVDHITFCLDHHMTRIDLTLPEPSGLDVLPATVDVKHLPLPTNGELYWLKYTDVFDDGHARGVSVTFPPPSVCDTKDKLFIKYAVDTTQDPWVLACSEVTLPKWRHTTGSTRVDEIIFFDGMTGKLCYKDTENYGTAVLLEIE